MAVIDEAAIFSLQRLGGGGGGGQIAIYMEKKLAEQIVAA